MTISLNLPKVKPMLQRQKATNVSCRSTVSPRYLTSTSTAEELVSHQRNLMMMAADDNLLRAVVRNERHVLRHLFPSEKPRIYDLRPRAHNFILPEIDDSNFIPRVLSGFRVLGLGLLSVYL